MHQALLSSTAPSVPVALLHHNQFLMAGIPVAALTFQWLGLYFNGCAGILMAVLLQASRSSTSPAVRT